MAGKESRWEGLVFKVDFEGKPDKPIAAAAYAFDRRGTLIAEAPVKDGQVRLDLGERAAGTARIFLAPLPGEKRRRKPTVASMERLHAYETSGGFDPKNRLRELLIPEIDWRYWILCPCRVRGRVVRPVAAGGTTHDMPVCHARVRVYEVDPLWLVLRRLPDRLIERIRDEILTRPPFPDPPPEREKVGPFFDFDPSVADFSPASVARMNRPKVLRPGEAALSPLRAVGTGGGAVRVNPRPEPAARMNMPKGAASASALPSATAMALSSDSILTVRRELVANPELIRPFLCRWPWFWPFLSCDEIAVLETNSHGRFDTTIFYPCAGDHPDLYFRVEYCIGGSWTCVYHPPARCNTWWNYACGTEVVLRVTDPRVPWCTDPDSLDGPLVAVMTVGNNVSLNEIRTSADPDGEGTTTGGQPFGGILEPHVWFGEEALFAKGVTHYRWSYRRVGDDDWVAMDRTVVRHYAVVGPAPSFDLSFKPFLLGPDPDAPVANLFKIPPKDPPAGSSGWAPMVDARENSASAFFLSHLLEGGDAAAAAGKYELLLELFSGTGARVNLTDAGVMFKVPTIDAPFGPVVVPTVDAPGYYLVRDEDLKVVGFRFVLRVDNNPCDAEIFDTETVSADGTEVTTVGPCGFLAFRTGSKVRVSFRARHPNDFATFDFGLYRGSAGEIVHVGGSVKDSPINGFVGDASGVFTRDIPVEDLLGSCTGGAAFLDSLHVDALVTDGWSTYLDYLDRDAMPKAFALTRHPGPAPAP